MKLKATIPKKSASLLLLRPNAASHISFYDYSLLVLQRKEKMSFGSGLVFPGGKLEPEIDQNYKSKYGLNNSLQSAALRECFEETGLYFFRKELLESQTLDKLSKIRLEYIANLFNSIAGTKQKSFQKISSLLPPALNLLPFIRLITIPLIKQRYDTTFYVLSIEQFKFINFLKYAEHQKYLHELDNIIPSDHQYVNFKWMSPAEILNQHFSNTAIIHPPQFIMLNVMLKFRKYRDFIEYLKQLNSTEPGHNLNLGPNIVSLIPNENSSADKYPFAATLLGDSQFPFGKIMQTEQCQHLKQEMNDWQEWQVKQLGSTGRNRFLFSESNKFFGKEYDVVSNASGSVIKHLQPWNQTHELLDSVTLPA